MLIEFTYEGERRQITVQNGEQRLAAFYNKAAKDRLTYEKDSGQTAKTDFLRSVYSMANGHEGTNGDLAELETLINLMLK